jgi:hypothetical protein
MQRACWISAYKLKIYAYSGQFISMPKSLARSDYRGDKFGLISAIESDVYETWPSYFKPGNSISSLEVFANNLGYLPRIHTRCLG